MSDQIRLPEPVVQQRSVGLAGDRTFDGPHGGPGMGWPERLLLLALLLLVAFVYWPGLSGGFMFDDYANIVLNGALHVTRFDGADWLAAALSSPASDLPRPLAMLSFGLNEYFTGLDPWPMKLTNLGVHLLNTLLVFGLTRSLMDTVPGYLRKPAHVALFVSACWALMPINLTAVLLVVQRMESLSHVFVFGGLWLIVVGRRRQLQGLPGWGRIIAGVLLGTGLGALSKESAFLLPLYALCLELFIFHFRRQDGSRNYWLVAFFATVIVIPAIFGLTWLVPRALDPAAYAHRDFSLVERLLTEPRVVVDYLRWSVLPDLGQLSLFHDDYVVSRSFLRPPSTTLAMVILLALISTAWWLRKFRPVISLGLSWFLTAHLLTATIIPLELVFEHRNYFASFGISLVMVDILFASPQAERRQSTLGWAACAILVWYGAITHLRALEWSNPLRFAQTEAAKHPQSPRATYQLGQAFAILSEGDPQSAFTPAAFAAFERGMQLPGANISPAQGALLLAVRTGKPIKQSWWDDIEYRLSHQPIGAQDQGALAALSECAVSRRCHFPPGQMISVFGAALSRGGNPEILNIYANYALNVLRDAQLAERLWKDAHTLNPKEPQYVISLTKLLIFVGREREAREQISALRLMGKLGQYAGEADALEVRLAAHQRGHSPH